MTDEGDGLNGTPKEIAQLDYFVSGRYVTGTDARMDKFPLQAVGGRHPMPNKDEVAKILDDLWQICAEVAYVLNLYHETYEYSRLLDWHLAPDVL